MPDARDTLKRLAKGSRHKQVEIKVPEDVARPGALKKIKRSGATRPYQLIAQEVAADTGEASAEGSKRDLNEDQGEGTKGGGCTLKSDAPDLDVAKISAEDSSVEVCRVKTKKDINRAIEKKSGTSETIEVDEADATIEAFESNGRESRDQVVTSEGSLGAQMVGWSDDPLLIDGDNKPGHLTVASSGGEPDWAAGDLRKKNLGHTHVGGVPTWNGSGAGQDEFEFQSGRTISNLVKRSLIKPDWAVDLTKDESFLRAFFRGIFGKGKNAKEVDLYCQLYAEARGSASVTLHFLSAQLGELVGSNSNGTIRARLVACERLGLLVHQGFNNETNSHKRGTYIHLRFPWR